MPRPRKRPTHIRARNKQYSGRAIHKSQRWKHRHQVKSALEKLVEGWLEEDGIEFEAQKAIGRCHVDIFLAPRIVIELQGCYFHGHALCQPEPLLKWQKDRHKQDARRYAWLVKNHYDVIEIWECEVEREPERVRATIRLLAGKKP